MDIDIVLPYQYYNLLMVFVSILTLLWSFKALKRFYLALRVRAAVLTDRIVHIRGLGSNLTIFEGATQTHFNAVVHTRQNLPPTQMKPLRVQGVVNDLSIITLMKNKAYQLKINTTISQRCLVLVILDMNIRNFQRMLSRLERDLKFDGPNRRRCSVSSFFNLFAGVTIKSLLASRSNTKLFPNFDRSSVSGCEVLYQDVSAGETSVSFNVLSSIVNGIIERHPSSKDKAMINTCVILVPIDSIGGMESIQNAPGSPLPHKSKSPTKSLTAAFIARNRYDELSSETIQWGSGTGVNLEDSISTVDCKVDILNDQVNTDVVDNDSFVAASFIFSLPVKSFRDGLSTSTSHTTIMSSTELKLIDLNFCMYNSLEIFGLSQAHESKDSSDAAAKSDMVSGADSVNTQLGSTCSGGSFIPDDCVVCLTEHKSIVLLPCRFVMLPYNSYIVFFISYCNSPIFVHRHLCVCNACLIYIDKCPVCRSPFEEYVFIQKEIIPTSSNQSGD